MSPATRAIILAGGASRRLGADKPEQLVAGRRLLDIALAAVAGADPVVVVGPPRDLPSNVVVVCEDPPGTGPVAAIAAGLSALPRDAGEVIVLAADLPHVGPETITALALARGGAPVAIAVDHDGRPQFLTAAWDQSALTAAVAAAPSRAGDLVPDDAVLAEVGDVTDVDTPAQLAAARAAAGLTLHRRSQ